MFATRLYSHVTRRSSRGGGAAHARVVSDMAAAAVTTPPIGSKVSLKTCAPQNHHNPHDAAHYFSSSLSLSLFLGCITCSAQLPRRNL